METPNADLGTTQVPVVPAPADNTANLTTQDIAKQIETLQAQQVATPAPEPGINQEAAQTVPPMAEPTPTAITQAEPTPQPTEPVGLEEIERLRQENETLRLRYSDSSREAIELARRTKELEAKAQELQQQQRRYTDTEVDAFVAENPQYASWASEYKKENLKLEITDSLRKEMAEKERITRYNQESNSALEQARKDFPEAFKSGTPMQKLAADIFTSRPAFKNDPRGVYFAAELAKARLIPANVTPTVNSQVQPTANTPFVEKGGVPLPITSKVDLKSLNPNVAKTMTSADLAKLLPHIDQQ